MKQLDYTGKEHERKMFKDFAGCLLKEANSSLREIEHKNSMKKFNPPITNRTLFFFAIFKTL